MFNLEHSISAWRDGLFASGIDSSALLDELESHLRDDIEHQFSNGADLQLAFDRAVLQMGSPVTLKNEFKKARLGVIDLMKHYILNLIGITEPQLATGMNAP